MNANVLSPTRFIGCDLSVVPAAAAVPARGRVCPAARPGCGGVAIQGDNPLDGAGRQTAGRSVCLARLVAGSGGVGNAEGQEHSAQAGGTGPGP
jgi:hypothetical protein